jgi:hypothetical protein
MPDMAGSKSHGAIGDRGLFLDAADYRVLFSSCIRRTPPWLYLATLLPPALIMAVVFSQPYVRPSALLQDPAALLRDRGMMPGQGFLYFGAASNLGVLVWSAAASVCLFTALLLAHRSTHTAAAWFLFVSGLFTAMLVADDFFMIHEEWFPYLSGLSEVYLFSFYVLFFACYLIVFHRFILRHHGMLLFMASVFFAIGMVTDAFLDVTAFAYITTDVRVAGLWGLFFEDGMKMFGIFAFVMFYLRTSWDLLISARLG